MTRRDRTERRQGVRWPAADDWYPTGADGCVRMRAMRLHDGTYRICFWGDDDFGMEYDTPDQEQHEAMLRRLPSVVTAAALRELGFRNA